ncbi:transcription factor RFX3-like isoform X7 [Branchiostoma floridae]|uniref:Transcription factor RFX3-like isoform X7 n=1 Tax=Branchiostoma floridae TaxID=7739 RepID=A0A9J7MCL3_BRAFL|nr:transcription factor RFX3-like isoform X7 [Branchiostoma floridae]
MMEQEALHMANYSLLGPRFHRGCGMATQPFVTDMAAIQATAAPAPSAPQGGQEGTTSIIQATPQTQQIQQQQFVQVSTGHVIVAGDKYQDGQLQEGSGSGGGGDTVNLQASSQPQAVYAGHVQYVEASDPSTANIYANGTIPTTYAYSDAQIYTQAGQTAYFDAGQTTTAGRQQLGVVTTLTSGAMGVQPAQATVNPALLATGGTYIIQGMDHSHLARAHPGASGHPVTYPTRASPITIQWLLENYETAEGVSLPRSTLYNHYLRHCQEHKLDPVNAASFGKLIRSVFLGLRTRRLGTRGNSKYHYYGIRIKATSPLNRLQEDQGHMAMRQQPINQGKRYMFKPTVPRPEGLGDAGADQAASGAGDSSQSQQQQHQQFLGDASSALPTFPEISTTSDPVPSGVTADDVKTFQTLYKEHCEAILDVVVNLQFALIEQVWRTFWRNPAEGGEGQNDADMEKRLTKDKLYILCDYEPVCAFMRSCDHVFYQSLVEVLIPDVLRPIPSALTQAIRNFAKSLEGWLSAAMTNIPKKMVKTKLSAVNAFSQTLRRYTSLNHLAQAARAVLQNTSQINQMLSDLNRVDFAHVQEQASWVCQCDDAVVHRLEQDFKMTLQQQNSLEAWAVWLDSVVNQVLKPYEGSETFPKAARQFLLKWSFYSSMVIRDLTLRSAASFGSFHLIRLLYDEYMFYLIEHRVAAATGETPIAVMGEYLHMGSELDWDEGMSEQESKLLEMKEGDEIEEVPQPGTSSDSVPAPNGTDEPSIKIQKLN